MQQGGGSDEPPVMLMGTPIHRRYLMLFGIPPLVLAATCPMLTTAWYLGFLRVLDTEDDGSVSDSKAAVAAMALAAAVATATCLITVAVLLRRAEPGPEPAAPELEQGSGKEKPGQVGAAKTTAFAAGGPILAWAVVCVDLAYARSGGPAEAHTARHILACYIYGRVFVPVRNGLYSRRRTRGGGAEVVGV